MTVTVSARVWLSAVALAPMCAVAQVGPLPDDGCLNARVTVSHPVSTIETFLDDLSGGTGVRLKADAAVKEDLIVLRVKDVPAREVMERVASHFDWSWRAEDGGYTLFQSKEQKEREEKAYEEQFAEPLRRAQVQVKQVLQQVRPARQEQLLVVVRVGARLMGSAAITLNHWDPNAPFVSPDQLPQPIKDAIEEARRTRGGGGATS